MAGPEQVPLELRPQDRANVSLGRSMNNLALATGELIIAKRWPKALELDCKPYPDTEADPVFPPDVMPVFTVTQQSARSYEVFTRLPLTTTYLNVQTAGAEVVSYHIEAPLADEWGWRISQVAVSHLYCCGPESVPPVAPDAAMRTLANTAMTVKSLGEGVPPVRKWPMRWLSSN